MLKFLPALLLHLLYSLTVNASLVSRPQVGVGYTNNANLTAESPQSDYFWWLRESVSLLGPQERWNLWLNYRVYSKTTENDVFTFRFGHSETKRAERWGEYDWELALGGQLYTRGNPANSEENFDNFFFESNWFKNYSLRTGLSSSMEPGYMFKIFPHLSGRMDHQLSWIGTLDWTPKAQHLVSPYLEIGLVFSNQSLYNKNYLELGTNWNYQLQAGHKFQFNAFSRSSAFPSRKVSETTLVFKGKGNPRAVTMDEIETQSLFQMQAAYIRNLEKAELKAALQLTNQATRSGLDDYSELQLMGSFLYPF